MNERTLMVNFDGARWHARDADGNAMPLSVADEGWLPVLPDGYRCEQLLLPLEFLLSRSFILPFGNPRLVDERILGQELEDRAGIEQDEWWLTWQVASCDASDSASHSAKHVAGMVFGFPVLWKQELEFSESWQQTRIIAVDGWSRLVHHLQGEAVQRAPVVVCDADADGLFFGLWQAGACRGIRRLNRQDVSVEHMAAEIQRSLLAMGGGELPETSAGLLDDALLQAMDWMHWQGEVASLAVLPERHMVNLDCLQSPPTLHANFRHGRWAMATGFAGMKQWQRSFALAAMLLLCWVVGMGYQNYQLNAQLQSYQSRIVTSFHRGLPDQKVMIDPLAQLRQAAGGGSAEAAASARWLQQLAAINSVYKKSAWDMNEMEWRGGHMKISGKAESLQVLNTIRQSLQTETGAREVTLLDTDLSGDKVRFRMQW